MCLHKWDNLTFSVILLEIYVTNVLLFRFCHQFHKCRELCIEWRRLWQLRYWWQVSCWRARWGSDYWDTCRLDNYKCCAGEEGRQTLSQIVLEEDFSRILFGVFDRLTFWGPTNCNQGKKNWRPHGYSNISEGRRCPEGNSTHRNVWNVSRQNWCKFIVAMVKRESLSIDEKRSNKQQSFPKFLSSSWSKTYTFFANRNIHYLNF